MVRKGEGVAPSLKQRKGLIMEKNTFDKDTLVEAMNRQTAAILAVLEVQREILQAVQELQISEDTVGSAMSRYRQKLAVVNGGLE